MMSNFLYCYFQLKFYFHKYFVNYFLNLIFEFPFPHYVFLDPKFYNFFKLFHHSCHWFIFCKNLQLHDSNYVTNFSYFCLIHFIMIRKFVIFVFLFILTIFKLSLSFPYKNYWILCLIIAISFLLLNCCIHLILVIFIITFWIIFLNLEFYVINLYFNFIILELFFWIVVQFIKFRSHVFTTIYLFLISTVSIFPMYDHFLIKNETALPSEALPLLKRFSIFVLNFNYIHFVVIIFNAKAHFFVKVQSILCSNSTLHH